MRKFIPLVVTAAFAPKSVTDLLVRPGDAIGLSFSLGRTALKPKDVQPRD